MALKVRAFLLSQAVLLALAKDLPISVSGPTGLGYETQFDQESYKWAAETTFADKFASSEKLLADELEKTIASLVGAGLIHEKLQYSQISRRVAETLQIVKDIRTTRVGPNRRIGAINPN